GRSADNPAQGGQRVRTADSRSYDRARSAARLPPRQGNDRRSGARELARTFGESAYAVGNRRAALIERAVGNRRAALIERAVGNRRAALIERAVGNRRAALIVRGGRGAVISG